MESGAIRIQLLQVAVGIDEVEVVHDEKSHESKGNQNGHHCGQNRHDFQVQPEFLQHEVDEDEPL